MRTRLSPKHAITTAGALALLLAAQVLAAPVTLSPTGDAAGSLGGVSGTGDASAANDCSYVPVPVTVPGCVAGVAASATGDATACAASGYGTTPCTGGAGTLVGDASACDTSQPSTGFMPNCIGGAAAATGDSTSCATSPAAYTDMPGCVGVAASGTGDADACGDAEDSDWSFGWTSCVGVAVSGTGEASACGTEETVTFDDSRCIGVALSGCDVAVAACTHEANASAPSDVALGPDADGDGFPAHVTIAFSRTSVDANEPNVTTTRDASQDVTVGIDPDDADPSVPLAEELRVTVPAGVEAGPDEDEDGFPTYVAVLRAEVVVERATGNATVTPEDEPILRVPLDANDADPNVPVVSIVRASVPSDVVIGPDNDGDGFPATVTVEFSTFTLDRRDPANATLVRDPARDQVVRTDANDDNPNVPVQSIFTASVPSDVVVGPDNDGDGFPATVTIESSTLTVDRRDPTNATLVRDPARDQVIRADANDDNPNVPVQSVFTASIPSDVVAGPDNDRDGFPATVTIEFSTFTLDRRDPANATLARDPARDQTVRTDANDNDPNVPVASAVRAPFVSNVTAGPDADGDGIPSTVTVEMSTLTIDRREPANATVTREPANDRTLAVDPDDADPDQQDVVGLSAEGPAEGDVAAVSGTGSATATCELAACVAFSASGDAEACSTSLACFALSGQGTARGYVAVSALGNAESCDLDFLCTAASGAGDASGHDVAASGLGDAQSDYVAVSGTGDADGAVPLSVLGRCNGQTCFATDGHGHWIGVAPSGDASGIVAASADGTATGGLVGVGATGPASGGIVAVSLTGDADGGVVAASGTGDAEAPLGVGGDA